MCMDEEHPPQPADREPAERKHAVVKRRWAILGGAGSGAAAVIAVAGAIALSDPTDQSDYAGDPTGANSQISAE
jgi:hypothetical protein